MTVLLIYLKCSKIFIHREFKLIAVFVFVALYSKPCHGVFFDCIFYTSYYPDPIGNLYTCSTSPNLTDNNPTELTAVRGNHTLQYSNSDVKMLQVKEPKTAVVDRLPTGISKFFPDLKIIIWEYAMLRYLSQNDFKQFPNLYKVSFSMNMIKQLDGNLFKFNKQLEIIDVSNNAIQVIGKNFFDGLTELRQITFYNNPCNYNMNMMPLNIEQIKSALAFYCSPANLKEEVEACPAQSSDRFDKIESRVSVVETEINDIKAFLKFIFQLKQ